eukprot:6202880-Pleurochrysis_carterae.AAC.3
MPPSGWLRSPADVLAKKPASQTHSASEMRPLRPRVFDWKGHRQQVLCSEALSLGCWDRRAAWAEEACRALLRSARGCLVAVEACRAEPGAACVDLRLRFVATDEAACARKGQRALELGVNAEEVSSKQLDLRTPFGAALAVRERRAAHEPPRLANEHRGLKLGSKLALSARGSACAVARLARQPVGEALRRG